MGRLLGSRPFGGSKVSNAKALWMQSKQTKEHERKHWIGDAMRANISQQHSTAACTPGETGFRFGPRRNLPAWVASAVHERRPARQHDERCTHLTTCPAGGSPSNVVLVSGEHRIQVFLLVVLLFGDDCDGLECHMQKKKKNSCGVWVAYCVCTSSTPNTLVLFWQWGGVGPLFTRYVTYDLLLW